MIKRSLLARIGWALVVLLYSAGLAQAAREPFWTFEAAGWEGGAIKDEAGNFSYCYITSGYEGGMMLGFSLTAAESFFIVLQDATWKLPVGSRYEVDISVDGRPLGRFPASAAGEDLLSIEIGRHPVALQRLRKGYTLGIEAAKEVFGFDLEGTARGLAKLRECYDVAMALTRPGGNPFADGGQTGRQANPFGRGGGRGEDQAGDQGRDQSRDQGAAGSPLYDERQADEDRKMVLGILLASGLEEVKFVAPAEIQYDDAAFAWLAGRIFGVLIAIPPQQSTLSEVTDTFLAGVAVNCAGDFRSQSPPARSIGGSDLKQFTAACREPGSDSVYYAGTSVGSSDEILLFLNFTLEQPDKLRRINAQMGELFVKMLRTD